MEPFVAVHLGAGKHSTNFIRSHQRLCKRACDLGLRRLAENTKSVEDIAVEVCQILEGDVLTNAGAGSELNASGLVECDVSLVSVRPSGVGGTSKQKSTFKKYSVCAGAVPSVPFPSALAGRMAMDLIAGPPWSLGRAKPTFLVGEGAKMYALDHGVTVAGEEMITCGALSTHKKIQQQISGVSNAIGDTVGVIIGNGDHTVAISSSGGISFKSPGRLGAAAVIGAGTDAIITDDRIAICCCSGLGEDIMSCQLASRICNDIASDVSFDFKSPGIALQRDPLYCGYLAVDLSFGEKNSTKLYYGHSTESMVIAYATLDCTKFVFSEATAATGQIESGAILY